MEKEILTLQELAEYADNARNEAKQKRLEKESQKQKACMEIIMRIVKELKTSDAAINVRKVDSKQFNLEFTLCSANVSSIELIDVAKMIIKDIPALDAVYTDMDRLEVSFSEAKVETKKKRE